MSNGATLGVSVTGDATDAPIKETGEVTETPQQIAKRSPDDVF